jgi:hypothetical protein
MTQCSWCEKDVLDPCGAHESSMMPPPQVADCKYYKHEHQNSESEIQCASCWTVYSALPESCVMCGNKDQDLFKPILKIKVCAQCYRLYSLDHEGGCLTKGCDGIIQNRSILPEKPKPIHRRYTIPLPFQPSLPSRSQFTDSILSKENLDKEKVERRSDSSFDPSYIPKEEE